MNILFFVVYMYHEAGHVTEPTDNKLIITNNSNVKLFDNAIGYGKSLEEISHNFFRLLRKVDKENKKLIII